MIQRECTNCYGFGMIEHRRCKGAGCDGCIEGELVCHKCNGLGYIEYEEFGDEVETEITELDDYIELIEEDLQNEDE